MADEIFISYSRNDEAFARKLALWINKTLNIGVWIDIEDIMPGIKWSQAIQDGLDNSRLMIVIITPTAMNSRNVEDEWQYFLDQDKPIIPLLLKSAVIPYQLRRIQYIDFSVKEEYNESLRQLVMEVRRHIKPTEAEALDGATTQRLTPQTIPAVTPSKAAAKRRERRQREARRKNRVILGLGAAVLLLGAAVVFLVVVVLQNEDGIQLTLVSGSSNDVRIFADLNDTEGRPYTPGEEIQPGERIRTGESVVSIGDGGNGPSALVEANSDVVVQSMDESTAVIGVAGGSASIDGGTGDASVQTPNQIDVNGPSARVTVNDEQLVAECDEGCEVSDQDGGTVPLGANQSLAVDADATNLANAEIRDNWGAIVFASRRSGAPDLYTMNSDGSNQRQLTTNGDADEFPVWSADGTQVLFSRGSRNLWLIDLSDPNRPREINLTGDMDLLGETLPAWSADGTRIAFVANSTGGRSDIFLMDADGQNLQQLTDNIGVDTDPTWSPDGRLIAFSSTRDGQSDIYVVDVTDPDAEAVNITDDDETDSEPAWSPDGTQIAYVRGEAINRDIYLITPVRGEEPTPLITSSNADIEPAWGPNSTQLVFVSQREGNDDVWIAPVANPEAAINLTSLPGSDDESPHWLPQLRAGQG